MNEAEKDEKKEEVKGPPEKYEPFKAPEGFEIDEATATEAGTLFKELGLSQEQGQKLIDLYAKKTLEATEAPLNHWLDKQEEWQKQIKEDPALGPKLPEIKATTRKFIDSIGDEKLSAEFREAMDYTGAGNNPAFIKAFYKLAQKYTEGSHVAGNNPVEPKKPGDSSGTGPQAMYPNLPRA